MAKKQKTWNMRALAARVSRGGRRGERGAALHEERPAPAHELALQEARHECERLLPHERVWVVHGGGHLGQVRVHEQRVLHAHVGEREEHVVARGGQAAGGDLGDHERRGGAAEGLVHEAGLTERRPRLRLHRRRQRERRVRPARARSHDGRFRPRPLPILIPGCASWCMADDDKSRRVRRGAADDRCASVGGGVHTAA